MGVGAPIKGMVRNPKGPSVLLENSGSILQTTLSGDVGITGPVILVVLKTRAEWTERCVSGITDGGIWLCPSIDKEVISKGNCLFHDRSSELPWAPLCLLLNSFPVKRIYWFPNDEDGAECRVERRRRERIQQDLQAWTSHTKAELHKSGSRHQISDSGQGQS